MPVLPDRPSPGIGRSPESSQHRTLTAAEWAAIGIGAVASLAVLWTGRRAMRGSNTSDGPPRWLRQALDTPMPPAEGLTMLRKSIIGTSRRGVRLMLGDPVAAGWEGLLVHEPTVAQRSAAATWYFQLSDRRDVAVAVHFAGDKADDAEFFHRPPNER